MTIALLCCHGHGSLAGWKHCKSAAWGTAAHLPVTKLHPGLLRLELGIPPMSFTRPIQLAFVVASMYAESIALRACEADIS